MKAHADQYDCELRERLGYIIDVLPSAWSRDSADPSCREAWSKKCPCLGQDDVTALLIQEVLGGEMLRSEVIGTGRFHFFNRLPNGTETDLTREQYADGQEFTTALPCPRKLLLERASGDRLPERYAILREAFVVKVLMRLRVLGF